MGRCCVTAPAILGLPVLDLKAPRLPRMAQAGDTGEKLARTALKGR